MNPRPLIYRFGLALMLVVSAWPAVAQDSGSARDEVQRLSEENRALRQQVETLTAELETLRAKLAAIQSENTDLANETKVLERQAVELQALAGLADDDRAQAAQAQRIQSRFDAEQDATVVTFGPEPLEVAANPGDFYFSVIYRHPGKAVAPADEATLFLQTYRAGRLFHREEAVDFIINGEPQALPITGFDLTPRKTGMQGRTRIDRSDEVVEFAMDRDTLARLGEARSLEIHQGRVVVTFDQDDLAALRAVARRMAAQ